MSGGILLCCSAACSDCITIAEYGDLSEEIFNPIKTVEETWGAYVPPTLDGFGDPIEGTGNPAYSPDYKTRFWNHACSRLLISPFIEGNLDDQTGTFEAEYILKTNYCGYKPFAPCVCFGAAKRPFAASYNSQQGTLLDTFPYWLGPPTTNADCPALSATGAPSIASVPEIDCPENADIGSNCCRVGGYEIGGGGGPLPTWAWLQSRSWWNLDFTFADLRLVLLVGYTGYRKGHKYPDHTETIDIQPVSDSGAEIHGVFLSYEP